MSGSRIPTAARERGCGLQLFRERSLDTKREKCLNPGSLRAERVALRQFASMGLRRLAVMLAIVVGVLGLTGWLTAGETPAAQRHVERIEPYDPLK